ncbi:MAG: Ger(x)C family spore germination protein, partial [Clostridia bacterium]|nr:Ger(x)C family spore germination protein [Clostridia bacterium]
MKKLVQSLKVILLILPLFLLSGCWGNLEVEETAYILAVGFDQGEEGNLKITFQIANPKEIGSGGGKGNKAYVFNTLEAPLPMAGYTLLNTIHTRQISLLHTKAYIFSEELAKKGIEDILYPLTMYRETRGSSYIFVCRGKAEEVMSKETINLESNPARQFELLDVLSKKLGFTSMVNLGRFYQE